MKKKLLALLCVFTFLESNAQNSSWTYDFGSTAASPYISGTYSSTYLPAPTAGGGDASVRASTSTEGFVELTTNGYAGGTGAELKMTGGTTTTGAKLGLAPFSGTAVGTFQCKINVLSGTNGRFLFYFGNGSNFTNGSGINISQTFAALRLSPTAAGVNLDWLTAAASPNYTTTGLTQTTINKNQVYTLKFFMNNSNSEASYTTYNGATPMAHNLPAGTFDVWLDNTKILTNADAGNGLLTQGTVLNGMNLLNIGAGSSAPVLCIDDISYTNFLAAAPPPSITNTILNVDYENGTTNSGITGVTATHALASDAVYMVPNGATGNYAVAHKVVLGNSDYYSDGSYRSESDAVSEKQFRYSPGDERRYEFSVLLKDWEQWNSNNPAYGDNIFQLKMSDGQLLPVRILTRRNSIVTRNYTEQNDLVSDFRPYINQWIRFRIDVKWSTAATGYLKIYTKLPDQADFNLMLDKNNFVTFTGNVENGNVGYIKWGVYREAGKDANGDVITSDNVLTRIVYHDDIRIFELNNASAPVQLWNNALIGPIDFTSSITTGNTVNLNILNDSSTMPVFFYGTNGGLNTAGALSGRVLINGWTNKTASSDPVTSFNPNQYFEFKLQPDNGYKVIFSNLTFTARKGNTTDPGTYVMRSSLDGFTTDITAPQNFPGTSATSLTYDLSPLSNVKTPITLRLYWYGSDRTSGTSLIGIDDFTFNGQTKVILAIPNKSDITKNTDQGLGTYTAKESELDITAINNCSAPTYSYSLTGATTATGTGSLANKIFNTGETTVTWTATDDCNSASTTFKIKVIDLEKPLFSEPVEITVNNDPNQCGAVLTLLKPEVSDNCAVASVTSDAPDFFPSGTTIVTWTAVDTNGNTAITTQKITVLDVESPVLNSIPAVTLCYDPGNHYILPTVTAVDNCDIKSILYHITGATNRDGNGLNVDGNFNVGVSSITWTVTDHAGNSSATTTTITINSEFSANLPDIYAVSPGGKPNTIYLGYGPSSLTLTATTLNGKAPYTYIWNNGATTACILVNPSVEGIHPYTVTVTDALGCSFTVTKEITITNILCAGKKVSLCHTSSPNHDKTLCISSNAVSAHLAHGCYLGSCESDYSKTQKEEITLAEQETNEFIVTAIPNPSKAEFNLSITGKPNQTYSVSIFDVLGRKIKLLNAKSGETFTVGHELKTGLYFAEITEGQNKKTVKLIKQ